MTAVLEVDLTNVDIRRLHLSYHIYSRHPSFVHVHAHSPPPCHHVVSVKHPRGMHVLDRISLLQKCTTVSTLVDVTRHRLVSIDSTGILDDAAG